LLSPINFLRVVDDMDEEEDATAGARLRCRRFLPAVAEEAAGMEEYEEGGEVERRSDEGG
jgi:hypothetical protein